MESAQKAPSGQAYRVVGYIGPENMVDRVETWVEHPILGDMHDEFIYSSYQDFGGLKAPAKVSLRQVGMETFVLAIRDARANPPDIAQLLTPSSGPGGGDPSAAGRGGAAATLQRRQPRRLKNLPTASFELQADTWPWPSSSAIMSSCSKAGRARREAWRSSPKPNG